MLNDLIVVDNIFDDPFKVRNFALQIPYYTKEKVLLDGITENQSPANENLINASWRGYRSNLIEHIDPEFHKSLFDEMFTKILGTNVNYSVLSCMHFTSDYVNRIVPQQTRWHRDATQFRTNDIKFAGVVYLNPEAPTDGGTSVILPNHLVKNVENVFNRAVIYNSNLMHKPNRLFGNNVHDARLTLTFFIYEMNKQEPSI